ncbi:MAG TPA: hypothetical protein VL120_17840 [Solirubrobacteraceae bacterium]|jgi:hypothetical protein|nr:hypothetical protein [Solirubrobacteraceae bacterium]
MRALAVLAACLLLAGCGGGHSTATRAGTATRPAAAATTTGAALQGTGYSLRLPAGWRDASREDTGLSSAPDLVVAATDPPAVTLVTRDRQPANVSAADLLRTLRRSEVDRQGVRGASAAAPIAVSGARGVTYHYDTTSDAGVKLRTRQVVVIHGRTAYTIALTTPVDSFAAADPEFGAILASWRWTG